MSPEKEQELKNSIIKDLMGSVSFGEIVKILHSTAEKEADEILDKSTEEDKEAIYQEYLSKKKDNEHSTNP